MSLALTAAAAVLLTPVSLDDPLLSAEGIVISEKSRTAMADGSVEALHCLDLPADHPDGTRACLTQAEWQAVFDHAAHIESTRQRDRAIGLAHWYAGSRP